MKRVWSFFLAAVMIIGLLPTAVLTASAAGTTKTVVYDRYNGSVWSEDGSGDLKYNNATYKDVGYSKTAAWVKDNTYDVTLTVKTAQKLTKSADAACVLVLDISTSMSTSDMKKMRTAATDFVNQFSADAGTAKREVAIVTFCLDVKNVTGGWYNANNATEKATLISKINSITTTGSGTNTHGGLLMAQNILNANAAAIADIESRFVILMTDGAPNSIVTKDDTSVASNAKDYTAKTDTMIGSNYNYKLNSSHWMTYWKKEDKISGSNWYDTAAFEARKSGQTAYGDPALYAAYRAKQVALSLETSGVSVYRIGYGSYLTGKIYDSAYTESTDSRLVLASQWLTELTGTSAAEKAKYKDATAADADVSKVFEEITGEINTSLAGVVEAWTVNDPLGDDVTFLGFVSGSSLKTSDSSVTLKDKNGTAITGSDVSGTRSLVWDMKKAAIVSTDGTGVNTYQLTYRVEVDADSETIGTRQYRLNGVTTLKYILFGDGIREYWYDDHTTAPEKQLLTQYFDVPKVETYVLSVTTPDAEKTYDTTALTKKEFTLRVNPVDTDSANLVTFAVTKSGDTYTVTKNGAAYTGATVDAGSGAVTFPASELGFAAGRNLKITVTGSQTNVGSSSNTISCTIVNDGGAVVSGAADDYNVKTTLGTLTVKEGIKLTTAGYSGAYDGQEHSGTVTPSVTSGTTLSYSTDGGSTWTSTPPTIKDAGSVTVTVKATNPGYDTVTETYTLEVTKREITLTSSDASKTYDGTALTKKEVNVTSGSWASGEGAAYDVTGSQTDAGSSGNAFTYTLNSNTKAGNYEITTVDGTLTVTKRSVTLTSADASKTYDGTALTDHTVTADGFVSGEGAAYDVTGSQTNTGSSKNTFTYTLNSNTKAGNYEVTTKTGTLTVSKITTPIIVTAKSASKVYDGTALTESGYTYTEGVLLAGDVLEATVSGSQTDAGSSANTVTSVRIMRGTEDVTKNYTLGTHKDGTLTVSKRKITLTSANASKDYDGKALTKKEVNVTSGSWASGEGAAYDVTGSQTDVGSSKNTFTYTLNSGTKAGNYEITTKTGTLTVNKNPNAITIEAASATRIYDGTALTKDTFTYTSGILADGDTLTAVIEGSQIEAGSSANTVKSYKVMRGTKDVTDYYTFAASKDGTLTVTPKTWPKMKITAKSASKVYDGTALTESGYTYTEGVLQGDDKLTAVVEGTITDAGTCANVVKSYKIMNGSLDVTASYTFEPCVDGTLTVTKRSVTLTSADASKTYDGTALTDHTVTADGFVSGEGAAYDVTGSQTNTGSSKNTFTYTLNSNTKAGNYEVTTKTGTLTVSKITTPIIVTAKSASKVYDGTALTESGYTYTEGVLLAGDVLEATVSGSQTDAGSSANTVTSVRIMRGTEDVTKNYTLGTHKDGTLTVNPCPITLTSADASKVYDGTALKKSEVNVTSGGWVGEDNATYTVTGSQTDAGSSKNTFTCTVQGATKAANYTITKVEGTLTVTPRPVTVTANDVVIAQGDSDPAFTASVDGVLGTDVVAYTFSRTSGTAPGDYSVTPGGAKKQGNYEITYLPGTLTIKPLPVTLQKTNADKSQMQGVGGVFTFRITVENSDDAAVEDVVVTDATATIAAQSGVTVSADGHSATIASLAGKGKITLLATHIVTAQDLLNGTYENEATAAYRYLGKDRATDPAGDDGPLKPATALLSIQKSAEILDKTTGTVKTAADIGDTVRYTITVKNTGTLPLSNVAVEDTKLGFAETVAVLAPEEEKSFTKDYTATETDILTGTTETNGKIANTATAKADPIEKAPGDFITVSPVEDSIETPTEKISAKIEITDTAQEQKFTRQNDVINFKLCVKNTGNTPLYNVLVTDTLTGGSWTIPVLSVGETQEYTVSYTVTSADVTAGKVADSATAVGGYDPLDNTKTVDDTDNAETPKKTSSSGGGGGSSSTTKKELDPKEIFTDEHISYIIGYPDGDVRPDGDVTRAEAATIFFRLLSDTARETYLSEENAYSDISPEDWFNTAISTLSSLGIVSGYPDGTFLPNQAITRAELSSIIARFSSLEQTDTTGFTDIAGHWAESAILSAASNGWIKGYEDQTFHPDQAITRAETCTMVNRVLERLPKDAGSLLAGMTTFTDNLDTSAWYYVAMQEASNTHSSKRDGDYEVWISLELNPDWKKYEVKD